MQVEAERKKRAAVLESEGIREAEINVAEGKKRSRILASEAERIEQVNQAEGRATALKTEALGKAEALRAVAEQINRGELNYFLPSRFVISLTLFFLSFSNFRRTGRCLSDGGRAVCESVQRTGQAEQHPDPVEQCERCLVYGHPSDEHL